MTVHYPESHVHLLRQCLVKYSLSKEGEPAFPKTPAEIISLYTSFALGLFR